jgi:hypothetical protein
MFIKNQQIKISKKGTDRETHLFLFLGEKERMKWQMKTGIQTA